MPVIVDVNERSFKIDEIPLQKGSVRIARNGDHVGIREVGSRNVSIVYPQIFSQWQNEFGVPYASINSLLTDLKSIIFT